MLTMILALLLYQKSNAPPAVRLVVTPSSALVGSAVTADGSGTTDPGSPVGPQHWVYNFGDGATSAGQGAVITVTHVYTRAAPFIITLTVTDNKGLTGTASAPVTITAVQPPPPDTTPPTTPTNLNPTLITQTSMTITWTPSTDASGIANYQVWMTDTIVQTVTATTANFVALTCATSYNIAVNAVDKAGNPSAKATLTLSTATCAAPPPIVQNPNEAIFTASPDHATLVARYDLRIYPASGSLAVATKDIGKPAPDTNNDIVYAELSTVLASVPDGDYVAKVAAVGTGGTTESTISNTFSVLASVPPPSTIYTIQVEGYDSGGEGVGYHDDDLNDIMAGPDVGAASEGTVLGWTHAGEWLRYAYTLTTSGVYTLSFRVSSQGAGGTFHLERDGVDVTGPMVVPDTGSWDLFTTITKTGVAIASGSHVFRLIMDAPGSTGGVGNFNWWSIQQ